MSRPNAIKVLDENCVLTWERQAEGLTTKNLNEAAWIDADTAWVIGDDGLILKTLTGGQ